MSDNLPSGYNEPPSLDDYLADMQETIDKQAQELSLCKDALLYWRNECSGYEPSISVFEQMVDIALGLCTVEEDRK